MPCSAAVYEREVGEEGEERRREGMGRQPGAGLSPQEPRGAEAGARAYQPRGPSSSPLHRDV